MFNKPISPQFKSDS